MKRLLTILLLASSLSGFGQGPLVPSSPPPNGLGKSLVTGTPGAITNNNPPAPFDADALAFITAGSFTNSAFNTATNTFIVGLKADGLWADIYAYYPCTTDLTGAPALDQIKWNLKDPRDLDIAFRMTITNLSTSNVDNTGLLWDGIDSYGNTHLRPSVTISDKNSVGFGFYNATAVNAFQLDGGVTDFVSVSTYMSLGISNNSFVGNLYSTASSDVTQSVSADSKGLYDLSRTTSTLVRAYRNGTQLGADGTAVSTDLPTNQDFYFGARNNGGGGAGQLFSTKKHVGEWIHKGWDATKEALFAARVNQYNKDIEAAFSLSAGTRSTY